MKYKVNIYDGSRNNLSNALTMSRGKGAILLVSENSLNEIEILGIENIIKDKFDIFKGLNCNIIISIGKYISDIDRINICSTKPEIMGDSLYEKQLDKVSENLSDFEKEMLNKYPNNIICIEYDNVLRENNLVNSIFNPKRDNVETFGEKNYDKFY